MTRAVSGGTDTMLLDDRCIIEVLAFHLVDIPICSWEPFSPLATG
jgi:hypothetical protein